MDIDGGKTIQGFSRKDLIDEMVITMIPIISGKVTPLVGKFTQSMKFKHTGTDVLNNTPALSRYTLER